MVVNRGVLQYILYITSVCNLKIEGLINIYVDDTCLLFSGISWVGVRFKEIV